MPKLNATCTEIHESNAKSECRNVNEHISLSEHWAVKCQIQRWNKSNTQAQAYSAWKRIEIGPFTFFMRTGYLYTHTCINHTHTIVNRHRQIRIFRKLNRIKSCSSKERYPMTQYKYKYIRQFTEIFGGGSLCRFWRFHSILCFENILCAINRVEFLPEISD